MSCSYWKVKKMKPLNNKEWKKFQKFVKEQDAKSTKESLGVSFYTTEFFIDKDGKRIKKEEK
jgi:hypothetical protein